MRREVSRRDPGDLGDSAALRRAAGSLRDAETHEWDADPGAWVRAARQADSRPVG